MQLVRAVRSWSRRALAPASAVLLGVARRVAEVVLRRMDAAADAVLGPPAERTRPAAPETRLALVLVMLALGWLSFRSCARGGGPVVLTPIEAPPLRVDPNHAPVGELLLVPGIGPVIAERIRRLRRKRRFRSLEDLEQVHGIGPVLAERMRDHVLLDDP